LSEGLFKTDRQEKENLHSPRSSRSTLSEKEGRKKQRGRKKSNRRKVSENDGLGRGQRGGSTTIEGVQEKVPGRISPKDERQKRKGKVSARAQVSKNP